MSTPKLSIGVSIGKNDLDIAAWYNMLKANKLPISTWTSNVVLAFVFDKELNIGTVKIEKKKESTQASLMFGSGNTQSNSNETKRGWKVRGTKGEYIEGSIIIVPIYKEEAAFALKKMKEKGVPYSSALKNLIRKYLKIGDQTDPPPKELSHFAEDMLVIESINKDELKDFSSGVQLQAEVKGDLKEKPLRKPKTSSKKEEKKQITEGLLSPPGAHEVIPDKKEPQQGGIKNPLLDLI